MFDAPTVGTEYGVDAKAFVPSSQAYGRTVAVVVRCDACGHGSVLALPPHDAIEAAYDAAIDDVTIAEEAGQSKTATRDLTRLERFVSPGRILDVGCWTGSFLASARARGWVVNGVEPSAWAVERARARGVDVVHGLLEDVEFDAETFEAIVLCDVIEHVVDPMATLEHVRKLLAPGGVLFLTVPDAGSRLARVLGHRWWSVLPMHLQYFTRSSMSALLATAGFDVVDVRTHPKWFSVAYYGERLGGFAKVLDPLVRRATRGRIGTRLVAPNTFDRMAVIARRA